MTISQMIGAFIAESHGSSLPEEAIHLAKRSMLDCVGVALAGGLYEPSAQIVRECVLANAGISEATIWGTSHATSALDAALVNGTSAHALDYDDSHRAVLGHPSTVLVPTVFAVGEKLHSSGMDVLKAYVVGLEVMACLGKITARRLYARGWHPTSILGALGASAAASYLEGLDSNQVANAIGIAASESSGMKQNFGSMTKPLHAGSAARKGIWSVALAKTGFTSNSESLEGRFGFVRTYCLADESCDLNTSFRFGSPFEIVASTPAIKRHPCCGSIAPVMDCVEELLQKHSIDPMYIASIDCLVNPLSINDIDRPQILDASEARFSLQYCLSVLLSGQKLSLRGLSECNISFQAYRHLASRIRLVSRPDFGEFEAQVNIRLANGQSLQSHVPEAKGSPALPLSDREVTEKFAECAGEAIGASAVSEAIERFMDLGNECDIGDVISTISPRPPHSGRGLSH